jgi:hypothetical protein
LGGPIPPFTTNINFQNKGAINMLLVISFSKVFVAMFLLVATLSIVFSLIGSVIKGIWSMVFGFIGFFFPFLKK